MTEHIHISDTNFWDFSIKLVTPILAFLFGLWAQEIKQNLREVLKLDKKDFCLNTINDLKNHLGLIEKYISDPIIFYPQYGNILYEYDQKRNCTQAKQERYSLFKGELQKISGKIYVSLIYSHDYSFHYRFAHKDNTFGVISNEKYFSILKLCIDIVEKSLFITDDKPHHTDKKYIHVPSQNAEEERDTALDAIALLQFMLKMSITWDKNREKKIKSIKSRFGKQLNI